MKPSAIKSRRLYLILDKATCIQQNQSAQTLLELGLQVGIRHFQWRNKVQPREQVIQQAEALFKIAQRHKAHFFLNDDAQAALWLGCGVHLGQEDLVKNQVFLKQVKQANIPWGISSHNLNEAKQAQKWLPSYLALGSMFASPTKGQVQIARAYLPAVQKLWSKDLVLIGGIHPQNIQELPQGKNILYAIISSAFYYGNRPQQIQRALQEMMHA